jgi:signal transduction histidine kinase
MKKRRDNTRTAQIFLFVLLAVSVVMVGWWLMDQAAFVASMNARLGELWRAEAEALDEWRRGDPAPLEVAEVEEQFPHLEVRDGEVQVSAAALDELAADGREHMRQYFWEGGFFLVVLVAGMAILWRSLTQEALLRQRQENFLAAVSHELKTPLASLQLATETMALRDPPPEKRQKLLERNLQDLARLGGMVSNLLDTSRLDEERVGLAREPVPLAEAVDRVIGELRGVAPETEVEIDIPPGLTVLADPGSLGTVLRNLIGNAFKATEGVEGSRVRLVAENGTAFVRLHVEDNGIGFPPDEAERLFEKFYRPGDELRRRSPGTGLGLYIVRRFMELGGGEVSARSEGPGRGATFTVVWPAEE